MISAIVCTYNREKYILECLACLMSGSLDNLEVIVVDNNSTDRTAELVKGFLAKNPEFPGRYVLETRQGLSNARNRGISEAEGDILVFLDDDALCYPGYMDKLKEAMAANPEAGAFGGRIHPAFEDGNVPKWLCRWSNSWVSGLDLGDRDKVFRKGKFPIGANMGFRRRVLEECGVFNPELGRSAGNLIGGEEKDLFNRVRAKGYAISYFHNVEVAHMIPPSRTTLDYVRRFADGVGQSEKIRSKAEGTYTRRLLSETVKWCATLVLLLGYTIALKPACGATLVLFRYHVTRKLL